MVYTVLCGELPPPPHSQPLSTSNPFAPTPRSISRRPRESPQQTLGSDACNDIQRREGSSPPASAGMALGAHAVADPVDHPLPHLLRTRYPRARLPL
eukprot:3939143-Rhodomonas_salina.2